MTYASDAEDVDVYAVADWLQERGWSVDRQQYPPSIHCSVNAHRGPVIDTYLADVGEAVAHVRAHPELSREEMGAPAWARAPRGIEDYGGPLRSRWRGADLSKVGEGDDDGLVLQLINRYGDTAMDALARIQALGKKLRPGR